jgi:hypothetical protein
VKRRVSAVPSGVFAGRVGRPLTRERRDADLFIAALLGEQVPRPIESFDEESGFELDSEWVVSAESFFGDERV